MWRYIDRHPSSQRTGRSRLRTRLLSVLCLAAGVILVVPGLMEPKELLVPLVVGASRCSRCGAGRQRIMAHQKEPGKAI